MSKSLSLIPADLSSLAVLRYPDPRLKEVCVPVEDPAAPEVRALAERMVVLMFAARGVGLAAPQVGVPIRLFVASATFQKDDLRVYVNPVITAAEGTQEGEEGCLSFPGITCKMKRYAVVTVEAFDLSGTKFQETAEGLAARIVQHETDHLSGLLLADRMGSVARLTHRQALRDLEERFAAAR